MKRAFNTTALGCALAVAALTLTGCPTDTKPVAPSWTYDLPVDTVPGRAYPAADGGYLIVGMIDRESVYDSSADKALFLTFCLMRLSATGEMLSKTPLDGYGQPKSAMAPDGHILVAVLRATGPTTSEARLLAIAPDGAITRDVPCRAPSAAYLSPLCIAATKDGGCVIVGEFYRFGREYCIVRFDAQGQVIWEQSLPHDTAYPQTLAITWLGASGFAIIGVNDHSCARVLRYDCDGNLRWSTYDSDVCRDILGDRIYMAPGPGDNLYIAGTHRNTLQTGAVFSLRRLDGDGNDLSTVLYDPNTSSPRYDGTSSSPSARSYCTIDGLAADAQGGVFMIGEFHEYRQVIPVLDYRDTNTGLVLHFDSTGTLDMNRSIGRDTRLGSITALPPDGYIGVGRRDGKLLVSRGELTE